MGQSAEKVARRLERHLLNSEAARIILKKPWRDNAKYGYVLAVTETWVVVHTVIQGFYLDDVALYRLQDIRRVERHPQSALLERVITGLGVPVATFDAERTATLSELLATVAARTELLMTYRHLEPGWLSSEVGTIHAVGPTHLRFHHLSGDGTWAKEPGLRPLEQIERVECGGRYLRALERFGDPPPPVPHGRSSV